MVLKDTIDMIDSLSGIITFYIMFGFFLAPLIIGIGGFKFWLSLFKPEGSK